ncbi:MAG: ATP-dependent Clp protease adaptor ClpS [Bacteroidia bacterium]
MKNSITETDFAEEIVSKLNSDSNIILYNDHHNTFDFVIETLVKVCKQDYLQAEQCAHLVHYKGKCAVKKGSFEILEPICIQLLSAGLTAEII